VNTVVEMIEGERTKRKEDASNQDKKVLIAKIIICNKDDDTHKSYNKNNEDSTTSANIHWIIYDTHELANKEDIQEIAK